MEHLAQAPEEELWLVADCSDLRKPYATELPYLMPVPDLDGKGLVPGYRTLNVLGITPGRRGILASLASLAVRLLALSVNQRKPKRH